MVAHRSKLFFDTQGPTVTEIRSGYRNCMDLSEYKGLTYGNVGDALADVGRKYSYRIKIPGYVEKSPDRYFFWDKEKEVYARGGKRHVPLDTPGRFNKFGPHIDLTKRTTTMKEIVGNNLSPKKLFRGLDPEKLLKGSYRGIGWWDPASHEHKILPIDIMIEGEKFAEEYAKEMEFHYQHGDALVKNVPALTTDNRYDVTVRILPITAADGAFYHEWMRMEVHDPSEDFFHRTAGGKKMEDRKYANLHKYANKERTYSNHTWGAVLALEERSRELDDVNDFLLSFPTTKREIMWNVWHALGNRTTIVGYNGRERRPNKIEARVALPWVVGAVGPEQAFDLTE